MSGRTVIVQPGDDGRLWVWRGDERVCSLFKGQGDERDAALIAKALTAAEEMADCGKCEGAGKVLVDEETLHHRVYGYVSCDDCDGTGRAA